MGRPLVTYILNAFNGAPFLEEAIASVLGQTYPKIELIIVDDGSTDGTPEILGRLRDPRVRLLRQPNMGSSFAGNRATALARGEYIGGIGQDDVLLPEKTEVQLRAMAQRRWDFCFTWADVIDADGRPTERWPHDLFLLPAPSRSEAMARFARGNFLCAPSSLRHRRCAAALARNVALFCVGDYYRSIYLFRHFSGGVLEDVQVRYRVHGGNLSFDDRYTPEYRRFEERAAKILASEESDRTRWRPFWSQSKVRALREEAEWLMSTGDPELGLAAYVAASRALNLAPLDSDCYTTLSRVLSWLGHEYPARLLAQRAERVGSVPPYPLPVIPSSPRRLYRAIRPALTTLSLGRWPRVEARLLRALDSAAHRA